MTARVVRNLSWVGAAFAIQQVIRLGTNVVLAMIVSPSVFGVMLILNTLRTGVEQLSDVGIGQNIVFDRKGNRPRFYNTAWTIQIIRGFVLFIAFLLLSPLIAEVFEAADLGAILPVFAPIFLITGFASPAIFLLQKNQQVHKVVALEVIVAIVGGVLAVTFALISPTPISLVYALLLSTAVGAVLAVGLMNWRNLRLTLDREMSSRIIFFGKWVFVSTLFYFAASNFDRLYLAATIPVAMLGIYGIARTFSDAAFQLAHKISTLVIFPAVSVAHHSGDGLDKITRPRAMGVLLAGALIGVGLALSDLVVETLYDERYAAAAFMLPVLLIGCWFSILSVIAESVAYGSGKPAINAGSNAAKFAWLVLLVPFALSHYGFLGALVMIALSDVPRYLFLNLVRGGGGRQFVIQDFAASLTMLCTAALVRAGLTLTGLAATFWPNIPAELLNA